MCIADLAAPTPAVAVAETAAAEAVVAGIAGVNSFQRRFFPEV
jgi:hypothetical protein